MCAFGCVFLAYRQCQIACQHPAGRTSIGMSWVLDCLEVEAGLAKWGRKERFPRAFRSFFRVFECKILISEKSQKSRPFFTFLFVCPLPRPNSLSMTLQWSWWRVEGGGCLKIWLDFQHSPFCTRIVASWQPRPWCHRELQTAKIDSVACNSFHHVSFVRSLFHFWYCF